MALAVHATRVGRQKMLLTCLTLTIVLGAPSSASKGVEYYPDYEENLVPGLRFRSGEWTESSRRPNPQHVQLMLVFYYIMTGLHAVHMLVGMGLLIWLVMLRRAGTLTPVRYMADRGRRPVLALRGHRLDLPAAAVVPDRHASPVGFPLLARCHVGTHHADADLLQCLRAADRADAVDGRPVISGAGHLAHDGWRAHRRGQGDAGGAVLHALAAQLEVSWLAVLAGLFWLFILMGLTLSDYLTHAGTF